MRALLRALALFSVLPVRAHGDLTRSDAVAALRWLPVLGAGLGAVAGLPLVAVREWAPNATLLGAVLSVCTLVVLTRALHLDGLADTADGLGSRAAAPRALEIMRASDIGPFGVLALLLVLLADVTALASLPGGRWAPVGALALAAASGRVAVLLAAHRRVRPAHASGFGAFVAGSVSTPVLAGAVAVLLAAAAIARSVGWIVAPAVALVLDAAFLAHVVRRLGGVTGDVFGALVELGTAATLAVLALS
jgi:adenosylcobinamide-GDP ribazoletransferase